MSEAAKIIELIALTDRLKLEAQIHAQEARAANATIADIYQCVTGSTGEPGNWNGAEPVRQRIAELEAENAALRADAAKPLTDIVLQSLADLKDEAAAHMWPEDLERFTKSEATAKACSVRLGRPKAPQHTVQLYTAEQVRAAIDAARAGKEQK
ncbi:MAG: hypothetical protein V4669_13990 [Pseudomonadota bacterium]